MTPTAPRQPPAAGLTRRRALPALALLGLGGGLGVPARAAGAALPPSRSLQAELARALGAGQPLVVMVSLHGCPWCELVRSHYLAPMHAAEGLPVVQLDMRSAQPTRDARGEPSTHDALVRAWQVRIAPTVLFLGREGQEVAERLVGGSPDFYAAYLDNRLTQARKAVAAG